MKISPILATLISAVAIHGATAGEWCPSEPSQCVIDDCTDIGASVSVGYETDYIFYGVRLARDSAWADVNYTFDALGAEVTVGAWHLTTLGSAPTSRNFDETDLYINVGLPSICGWDLSFGYTHYFFPTDRPPSNGITGDSTSELNVQISRHIAGFNVFYRGAYDFVAPGAFADANFYHPQDEDNGSWVHTLGVEREICFTDYVSAVFSAGVLYTDNYWHRAVQIDPSKSLSGWNNYYVQAAFPIALNCRATLTPYVGYNGTPDGWVADGIHAIGSANNGGANGNDVLHGGVSLTVNF